MATILFTEHAEATLKQAATASHPSETGGVLVGVTAVGVPWVTEAIEIQAADHNHWYYTVPEGRTKRAVQAARHRDARLGYLGEWHSHPLDVGPSLTDRQTMRAVAWRLRRPAPGPVFCVVRSTSQGHTIDLYNMRWLALRPAEALRTGPLSPPEGDLE